MDEDSTTFLYIFFSFMVVIPILSVGGYALYILCTYVGPLIAFGILTPLLGLLGIWFLAYRDGLLDQQEIKDDDNHE